MDRQVRLGSVAVDGEHARKRALAKDIALNKPGSGGVGESHLPAQMTRPKIISSNTPHSELERFARRFHQDWRVEFSAAGELVDEHLRELHAERRASLKQEAQAFLRETTSARRSVRKWAASGRGSDEGLRRLRQHV